MNGRFTRRWLLAVFAAIGLANNAFAAENIDITGVSDATPNAGDTIVVSVAGGLGADGDAWTSTGLALFDAGNNPVINSIVCVNQPNPNITAPPTGTFPESINFTIPVDLPGGTYDVVASGYDAGENCDGSPFDGTFQDTFEITVAPVSDLALSLPFGSPTTTVAGAAAPLQVIIGLDKTGGETEAAIIDFTGSTLPAGVTITGATGAVINGFLGGVVATNDLAPGASISFALNLAVASNAADGAVIKLVGVASNDTQADPDLTNNTLNVPDITVEREFDLALSVVDEPDPVLAGSGDPNLTHTFTLSRSGPSNASGVTVTVVPSLPTGVTIVGGGATVGSFDPNTGIWSIPNAAVEAADNGTVGTLDIVLTVDNTAESCDQCVQAEGTVAAASGTDTNPANDTAVDPTSIESAEGAPTTFLTTIGFTNGYPGEVTVMISCNSGTPLEQDFEISAGTPVDFVVDLLDFVAPDVDCTVTLEAVDDGYVGSFLANGVDTGDACLFSSEPEAGEAPFNLTLDRENTCEITAEPVSSTFEVEKVWEFEGDAIVGLVAGIDIWCEPASATTGPDYGKVSTFVHAEGNADFGLSFYPHWNGETTCYAEEGGLDSSVESDQGCLAGTGFAVGDDDKGCTITNTVFFEGIPTLSQYGLGLMALLMLSVGFVGLRRFV